MLPAMLTSPESSSIGLSDHNTPHRWFARYSKCDLDINQGRAAYILRGSNRYIGIGQLHRATNVIFQVYYT
jgi:hypothetical protein